MSTWLPPAWRSGVVEHDGAAFLAVARPGDEPLTLRLSIDPLGLRSQWASLCARAWLAEAHALASTAATTGGR